MDSLLVEFSLCDVLRLAQITFLHYDSSFLDFGRFECNQTLIVSTRECSRDVRYTLSETRSVPLVVMENISAPYLALLEATCYPGTHVWCWIRRNTSSLPAVCDGFVICRSVEGMTVFEQFVSPSVTPLMPHSDFQMCNKNFIIQQGGAHSSSTRGLTLSTTKLDIGLFTDPLVPAEQVAPSKSGFVEGIERSLLDVLVEHFNLTLLDAKIEKEPNYHFQDPSENYDGWKTSTIGYLVRKKSVLVFGDLSMVFPRHFYVDFLYPTFGDGMSFMSKMWHRPYSGIEMISVYGYRMTALHVCAALVVALIIYHQSPRRQKNLVHFVVCFTYTFTLVFHASKTPPRLGRTARYTNFLWRSFLLILSCYFAGRLCHRLTAGVIDGLSEGNVKDIGVFLKHNRDAFVIHHPYALYIDDKARFDNIFTERGVPCSMMVPSCVNKFLNSRVSFVFNEGNSLRRAFWMHIRQHPVCIMRQYYFYFYAGFAMPRGCFLRHAFSKVVQASAESGLTVRFQRRGGLAEAYSIPARAATSLHLEDLLGSLLVVLVLHGFAALIIFAELIFARKKQKQLKTQVT